MQTFRKTINTTRYMLSYVLKERYGRLYIYIKSLLAIANALVPIVYILFPGLIINELTGANRINIVLLYVGILITTPVINRIINEPPRRKQRGIFLNVRPKVRGIYPKRFKHNDYNFHIKISKKVVWCHTAFFAWILHC